MRSRIIYHALLAGVAAVFITGCASTARHTEWPTPRPLGAEYASVGRETGDAQVAASRLTEATGTLNLKQALALALLRNPGLATFSYDVRAAEARALQAGLLPNPELELGVGEYDRDGEGSDSAEIEVMLGQLFELGGKRRRRMRIAEAAAELTGWDYESKRLDVFAETSRRFMEGIAAQRRVALAEAAAELAEKTAQAVAERVKAGKEPPLQAVKAEAELEMARMEGLTAHSSLGAARANLAAMWGAEEARFETVAGDFESVADSIPNLKSLQPRLSESPELSRWEAEIRLREVIVASEKAARVPDLEAAIGLQRFEEDGTDALAFGIGVPLLLFDRNQGNIAAAKHELAKAKAERRAAESALVVELANAHATLRSAQGRALTLRSKVVPAMEGAFAAAHEGYKQGKFGFLDMLDAQRQLFEAKGALVDALSNYHAAVAEIQRITGTSIEDTDKP